MSPLKKNELKEFLVGKVIEYQASTQQALVELSHEYGLCVGDTIRVRGTPEWDQLIERMSQNGKPVAKVFPGESVWIHFQNPAQKGDEVFLLIWVIPPGPPPRPPSEPQPGQPKPQPGPPSEPDLPGPDSFPTGNGGKRKKSKGKGPGSGG